MHEIITNIFLKFRSSNSQHEGCVVDPDHYPAEAGRKELWHLRYHGKLHSPGGRQGLVYRHGLDHRWNGKPGGRNPTGSRPARPGQAKVPSDQRRLSAAGRRRRFSAFHFEDLRRDVAFRDRLQRRSRRLQARNRRRVWLLVG